MTKVKDSLPLILMGLCLLTKPYYLSGNGLPQLTHWFAFLFAAGGYAFQQFSLKNVRPEVYLLAGWITLVNIVFFFLYNDFSFIIHPAYHGFNLLITIAVYFTILRFKKSFIPFIYNTIALSIIVLTLTTAFFFFFVENETMDRLKLFFNNPNQMGLYGLVCTSYMWFFFERYKQYKSILTFFLAACAAGVVVISFSRAGIISEWFLILLLIRKMPLLYIPYIGVTLGAIFFIKEILEVFGSIFNLKYGKTFAFLHQDRAIYAKEDWSVYNRLLKVRGWPRFWEYPKYLIFGAGEGAYSRFYGPKALPEEYIEVHSSFGHFIYSYGVIGLGIITYTIRKFLKGNFSTICLYLAPLLIYQAFHNTLRDTFVLIFATIVATLVITESKERD